jgi:hypothetical protein
MHNPIDFATLLGGYAFALGAVVMAWASYHWQAIRRRELTTAAFIELALLILFVLVVAAWVVEAPWAS